MKTNNKIIHIPKTLKLKMTPVPRCLTPQQVQPTGFDTDAIYLAEPYTKRAEIKNCRNVRLLYNITDAKLNKEYN
jgi:hypothetical protein